MHTSASPAVERWLVRFVLVTDWESTWLDHWTEKWGGSLKHRRENYLSMQQDCIALKSLNNVISWRKAQNKIILSNQYINWLINYSIKMIKITLLKTETDLKIIRTSKLTLRQNVKIDFKKCENVRIEIRRIPVLWYDKHRPKECQRYHSLASHLQWQLKGCVLCTFVDIPSLQDSRQALRHIDKTVQMIFYGIYA